jgi:membrane protein CcdC involved in cytochrome C biogenesis
MNKTFAKLYGAFDFYVGGLLTVAFLALSIHSLLNDDLRLSGLFFCLTLGSLALWRLKTTKRLLAAALSKISERS